MENSSTGIMPRVLAITAAAGRIAANGYGKQSEWTSELMDAAKSGSLPIHEYLNRVGVPWIVSTVKTVDVQKYLIEQHGLDLLTVKAGGKATATVQEAPDSQPAPAQDTATTAPAGASEASDGAEQGLTTLQIAHAFDGVSGWTAERWIKNLSAAKWVTPALIGLGEQGGASSVWRPLKLAQLAHARAGADRENTLNLLQKRFNRQTALTPWCDAFNEFFATFSDAD